MKTIKQISAALLALLALTLFSITSQAQTTNLIVNQFNTAAEVTNSNPWNGANNGWGNWYGVSVTSTWDSAVDANNNPGSGSMRISAPIVPPPAYSQYAMEDGFFTLNADTYNVFTNLSFDIKFAANSVTRTNGDGVIDFGGLRVGAWDSWAQDWFYYFSIPATNGLGQPNTNWTHISIPINQSNTIAFWPALTSISDVVIGMDAGAGGNVINGLNYGGVPLSLANGEPPVNNTNLNGTQIYWVDNIQFIGPAGGIVHPPPVMSVEKTRPALRAFIGAASIYARSQLTSVDQNQSWIGAGTTYPVTYSFTLLDFPNVSQVQAHLELIPGPGYTGNPGADYGNTNCLWLQILSDGAGGYTANVAWKTNAVNANPNDGTVGHTALSIASSHSPAGTWTLTFNSTTTGSLTAPGVGTTSFTITALNVAANFGNPCVLVIGNQPNGVSAGEGLPSDYSRISVSGVAGTKLTNDFTTATSLDPAWTLGNSDNANTLDLVTTNTPYWVKWTLPDTGFELGVATNVTCHPLILPEYYNGYFDVPTPVALGKLRWYLVPSDCLPPTPNAFFRLSKDPGPLAP